MSLNTNNTTDVIVPTTGKLTVNGNIVPADGVSGGDTYIRDGNQSPPTATGAASIWFNGGTLYVKTSGGVIWTVAMTGP